MFVLLGQSRNIIYTFDLIFKQLLREELLLRQLPTEKLIEEYYAEKMKEMVSICEV